MPRNLTPDERDRLFGPLVVYPELVGRDAVRFQSPPGPPPLVEVQFGPHVVKVHERAAESLSAIAEDLDRDGLLPAVESIVGFQPRLVRTTGGGNKPVLSAHAYGVAVDVNAAENPQGGEATDEQKELVPYFEGHGWYWGGRFSDSPDPHHFVFDGVDPTLTEQGLTCPVNREVWGAEHVIKLWPGKVQRWILAVTAPRGASLDDLELVVRSVFTWWAPLIAGEVQVPAVSMPSEEEVEQAMAGVAFELGTPLHLVAVEFGYRGQAGSMPVPTFVRRRRDRIEPTCPVPPIDVAPLLALQTGRDAEFDASEQVTVREPFRDPWDVGLGPIDPDAIRRAVEGGARTIAWMALGIGVAVVVAVVLTRKRGRSWS